MRDLRNPRRGGRRRILSDLLWTTRPLDTHLKTVQVASTHRCFPSDAKRTGRTSVSSLGLRFRPAQERLVGKYPGRNNVRPWKAPANWLCQLLCRSARLVFVRKQTVISAASARLATNSMGLLRAASSRTFRSVEDSWARQSPFEACRQSSNLTGPRQSSNLTDTSPDHYNFWAAARHGFVFGKESERCVSSQVYAIDRRMRMIGDSVRHIMVKTVYGMGLSCSGATGGAIAINCNKDIVSS
jgi:hypothetical protein